MLLRRSQSFLASAVAASLVLVAPPARAQKSPRECIEAATEGQRLRDRGKLLGARAKLLVCSNEACPSDIRMECGRWLARVEQTMPHVVFGARDANGRDLVHVRVLVGGAVVAKELLGREQDLDPGPYEFVFEAEDGARVSVSAVVRTGDATRTIVATFPAAAPRAGSIDVRPDRTTASPPTAAAWPAETRTVALVATGAGALLATGALVFFAVHAGSSYSDLERSCAPGCSDADVRSVRTDLVLANVSGIAALALGAAFGGIMIFTRPSSSSSPSVGAVAF
ncbi:MAG: hypothetical protein JWP87_4031 [Labilithrix sp.]|nr:hypothetical protein [Labilithrix sp.]